MKINGLFIKGGYSYKRLSSTLSVLISLLLILSIFLHTAPVKATGTAAVIKVDNKIVQSGDIVDVGVSVYGSPDMNLAGYDFKITYDPSFLQVLDVKGPSDIPLLAFNVTIPGEISAVTALMSGTGLSGDLQLFNISVKVLGQVGQSDLTLTVNDFSNDALDDIPYTVSDGSVSIQQVQPLAPNVSVDDVNNVILGIDNTMEYSLDGGLNYVLYDAQGPDLSGAKTVLVRVAADGSNPAGLAKALTFTTNPVENTPLKVIVTNATGVAGSEVQVGIDLQDVPQAIDGTNGLVNSNFKILYDSRYLEVKDITAGTIFENVQDFAASYTQTPGEVVFLSQDDSMGERLISDDGNYATINFLIKPEAPIGEYMITFADDPKSFSTFKLLNNELSSITPITVGGKITVNSVIGDVNGDNVFDVTDFGYLKLFLLGKITSFPSPNGMSVGNVDGQGTSPDVTDFGYMKLRLLGKIVKFPIE